MKLLVHEQGIDGNSSGQVFETLKATKDIDLYAVRAHLMIVGPPSGTVTMRIARASDSRQVATSSDTHTIADLLTTENNGHGMYRFIFDYAIKSGETYNFILVTSGGYSYSASSFIGWCAHSEFRKSISLASSFVGGGIGEPKHMEFWAYQNRQKGVA